MKKFNFIDLLIVLTVIAILVVGWMFINNKSSVNETSQIQYSILLKEVPEEVANNVTDGADIFDGVKIINIGVIQSHTYEASTRYEFSEQTGEYVQTVVPDMYDVTINVVAEGGINGLAHSVNEYDIYVGKSADVKSVGFVGHGVITSVGEVLANEK